MNRRRLERDWELLSAYLDGELKEAESQHLERRLSTDAALQDALQALRSTRAALRSLKPKRAPHNFTLSAETAEAAGKTPAGWFSPLRLASAAAALVMLVTLAAGMFSLYLPGTGSPAAAELAFEQAADAEAAGPTPPPLIFWGPPGQYPAPYAEGLGGGGGGGAEPPAMVLPAPQALIAPEAARQPAVEPNLQAPAAPAEAESLQAPPQPEATPPAEEKRLPQATPTRVPPPLEGSGPILGIAPPEEQGRQTVTTAEPAAPARQAAAPISGWFTAAILCALAAAAAWIADIIIRRRKA